MLVLPDGQVFGTIGGGCGEAEVRREALDALATQTPGKYTVNMTNDLAEEEGMVCGGIMDVFIDILNPGAGGDKKLLADHLAAYDSMEEPVLVTVTDTPDPARIPPGSKLFITNTGRVSGDLGVEQINRTARQWANQVRSEGKTRLVNIPVNFLIPASEVQLFFEAAPTPVDLLILGGGHIALPLATMAKLLGYRVTVVDDRPAFANRSRFPGADRVICNDFVQALGTLDISPKTFVVIVTRGHRHDKMCLREVITRPNAYIGMIGSRRRVKALMAELQAEGISPEYLQRVHSPIGLDIAAETPEEIAVGILAELIKVHRGGQAQSRKLT